MTKSRLGNFIHIRDSGCDIVVYRHYDHGDLSIAASEGRLNPEGLGDVPVMSRNAAIALARGILSLVDDENT